MSLRVRLTQLKMNTVYSSLGLEHGQEERQGNEREKTRERKQTRQSHDLFIDIVRVGIAKRSIVQPSRIALFRRSPGERFHTRGFRAWTEKQIMAF